MMHMTQKEGQLPLFLLVAAGGAEHHTGLPVFERQQGVSVVRGRLPGASELAVPSSSQNIWARELRQNPRSGITGEDCSQPPMA